MQEYLQSVPLAAPIIGRVETLLVALQTLCPEPLNRIFVTDLIEEATGERRFDSLWAFSETFMLEAREFRILLNADVSPYSESISYIGIEYEDLSFGGASTEASRLSVEVQTGGPIYNRLTATGSNCEPLEKIIKEVFVPNLRTKMP